jgi:endonuclease YncB( thermonuclease family)
MAALRVARWLGQFVFPTLVALAATGVLASEEQKPVGEQVCASVERVHDGDTFTCSTSAGPVRVRVAGIDAPETGQAFWRVSRDLLRQRISEGTVVNCYKVDRFKRQVCRVKSHSGRDEALGLVEAGLAWRTRKYADEQTADERELYDAAESGARARGLGIWSQPDPQEPSACRALKEQRQKCR